MIQKKLRKQPELKPISRSRFEIDAFTETPPANRYAELRGTCSPDNLFELFTADILKAKKIFVR